jgi:hypothetical protein
MRPHLNLAEQLERAVSWIESNGKGTARLPQHHRCRRNGHAAARGHGRQVTVRRHTRPADDRNDPVAHLKRLLLLPLLFVVVNGRIGSWLRR